MTETSKITGLKIAHAVYSTLTSQLRTSIYDNRLLAFSHSIVLAMSRLHEEIHYHTALNNAADIEPLQYRYLSMLAERRQKPKCDLSREQAKHPALGVTDIVKSLAKEGEHLYAQYPHFRNHSKRVVAYTLYCQKKGVLDVTARNLSKLNELEPANYQEIRQAFLLLAKLDEPRLANAF